MGLPIPDLDDKTFEALVQEARTRIPRYAPDWTDHNLHDPGITFIDLFAWLAEMQIYQLNQVTEKHYRKFLELVHLPPIAAQPATVEITFANSTGEKLVPAGTQFLTEVGSDVIAFETVTEGTLIPVNLRSIITTDNGKSTDNTLANQPDDLHFAPFTEKAPVGAILNLGFDQQLPAGKEIRIAFILYEADLPKMAENANGSLVHAASVELVWEYFGSGRWNKLEMIVDSTSAFTHNGAVVFTGPPVMDLHPNNLYWIRCRLNRGQYEIVPQITRILLNTIPAVQIETIRNEAPGRGSDGPEQIVYLNKAPVVPKSLRLQTSPDGLSWEDWQEAPDFNLSGPADRHYVLNTQTGEITFGNGLNGKIPDSLEIRATRYQTTRGTAGNVPKGQHWYSNQTGFQDVTGTNILAAAGGRDPETLDAAKARARDDLQTIYRAVTAADYETLALQTPGVRVARTKALPNYHPELPCLEMPGAMTVVVVPFSRKGTVTPVPGPAFLAAVYKYLDSHRLVTTDLFVIGPQYVKISVAAKIHPKPKSSPELVRTRVETALKAFLDPLNGGPEGNGWPFGRAVFPSEIYQLIDNVNGVDYVTDVVIIGGDFAADTNGAIKIPPNALVYTGELNLTVML